MAEKELKKQIEEIIRETLIRKDKSISDDKPIPLEASGRHVHLCQDHVDQLFGKGYRLTPKRELSQPGQFLAEEKVKLIGKKGIIEKAAVLGPARSHSQVELSKTDSIQLGIDAPLRFSGDIKDSASVFIASAENVIKLEEGVIIAKRHIHMTPKDAVDLGVEDRQIVSVEALTERPVVFKDVLVRVNKDYSLNMHIDYDEANACLFSAGDKAKIIK
ncbi:MULTISPECIES: phosphate propanoyltransferase [Halanaerobium]|jgi:propanediol utilization protein|uniref:phosphate propanoyltransferase n=1 Tax=Halanaerobium TaxID=2330 RepID=UPI000DE7A460|nr:MULTISPECIES: phosphate propanoyltransferase [Halanaerobium]PUU86330.1 MAG: Phosphate propanoyltransferase [Halanaerobium sp.]TDP05708.1 propanediol utilization protein [Halanaerobium congolense]